MKRFHISNHIYYLFKLNNREGTQSSYEDVFVPKIFINLFNLSSKQKKQSVQKKSNQTKFFLLNSNSYFSNNLLEKFNTGDINNLIEYKKFGNDKRYFSAFSKNFKTYFPTFQESNKDIKNIIKTHKIERNVNKKNKIQNQKFLTIDKKVSIPNKIIKIKNIECSKYNKEIEKNKEKNPKRFINLSVEYINKEKNNREINELFAKKKTDINKNNYINIKLTNSLIKNYKCNKTPMKNYNHKNDKNAMRTIHYLKNLNKNNDFSSLDQSLFLKKKLIPNLPKLMEENSSKLSYKTPEKILKLIYKKKIDFPLINDNELYPTEKFYFCVNKRYKYQLIKYMRHRINWEFHEANQKNYDGIIINFEWKYYSHKVNFKNFKFKDNIPLKKLKIINLFEKNYEIGNKKNMFINLLSYCDSIGYNIFDIVPFTLIISNTKYLGYYFSALKELIEFIPKENNLNKNILTNRKYNQHFWFDRNYLNINNQYIYFNKNFISSKNYWILKPPDLYQGKCIEIGNDYDDLFKKCKKDV